jgi:methanogenic corrinoid protein MtbC1
MGAGAGRDLGGSHRDSLARALRRAYTRALLAGDEVAAEEAVRDAMAAHFTEPEVYDQLITPAMWIVGARWEAGEISVADEHLATEITLRVLALQREARRTAARRAERLALLGAPAGEQHVVALRMVGSLLAEAGYDVRMLGPDVPVDALAEAVARHDADLVCLTATMAETAARLGAVIEDVQRARPRAGRHARGPRCPGPPAPAPGRHGVRARLRRRRGSRRRRPARADELRGGAASRAPIAGRAPPAGGEAAPPRDACCPTRRGPSRLGPCARTPS